MLASDSSGKTSDMSDFSKYIFRLSDDYGVRNSIFFWMQINYLKSFSCLILNLKPSLLYFKLVETSTFLKGFFMCNMIRKYQEELVVPVISKQFRHFCGFFL